MNNRREWLGYGMTEQNFYEDINVSKALTDMKKDEVLEQYKFFVDSPNLGTDTDGTVRIVRR